MAQQTTGEIAMTTLILCLGMWLGICGQIRHYDFPTVEACERERAAQIKSVGSGYAVCVPKKLN
jgi:hypothetical protein